jgi:hypothetical protein
MKWDSDGQHCSPTEYLLQGYRSDQLISNQLDVPRMASNSASGNFTFSASQFSADILYFRVSAMDGNGISCGTSFGFYHFSADLFEAGL